MRDVILYVRNHGRLSSFTRVEDAETGEPIPYVDLASRCEIVREGRVVRIRSGVEDSLERKEPS